MHTLTTVRDTLIISWKQGKEIKLQELILLMVWALHLHIMVGILTVRIVGGQSGQSFGHLVELNFEGRCIIKI